MFNFRLLELESELLARELAAAQIDLNSEGEELLSSLENEIGVKLGAVVAKDWRGWLCYRRGKSGLVICRGRSCPEGVIFVKHRAGLDVPYGIDAVTDYERGFDVTPPQELDHLLVNFRSDKSPHILVWYGENFAPYHLFFDKEAIFHNQDQLKEAISQGCIWIMKRPKGLTLPEFLKTQS